MLARINIMAKEVLQEMISNSHRFIFIHIPKTAGSSIAHALQTYSHVPVTFTENGNAELDFKHITAREIHGHIGELWDEFFSFAVVRNPWERVVSNFFYLQSINHPMLKGAKTPREWVISHNIWCYPAAYYITIEGAVAVKRVLRYENLQNDFNQLCGHIGIPQVTLTSSNRSAHAHYSTYYDDESCEIVAEVFKDDIELFGYGFDKEPDWPKVLPGAGHVGCGG